MSEELIKSLAAHVNADRLKWNATADERPYLEMLTDSLREFYASRPAPAVQVPDGYALVPVEPTPRMLDAVPGMSIGEFRHMLAAAPAPATSESVLWYTGKDAPATGATEAVAQGGGVDVDKVMALVQEFGEQCEAAGYLDRSGSQDASKKLHEAAYQTAVKIRALLSASPAGVGGWIPVSERLPDVGAVVLGFWRNNACPHSHITGNNYGITARNEHGLWYDASEDDNKDDELSRPDYWQSLPPAPAATKKEEGHE